MNEMNNATCTICGKPYKMCNTCSDQISLKPWKSVTDTIEHYKIYLAIHGYTLSKNKEIARKELEKCDLSDLENFETDIKTVIKNIMGENKKVKMVSKAETEKVSE